MDKISKEFQCFLEEIDSQLVKFKDENYDYVGKIMMQKRGSPYAASFASLENYIDKSDYQTSKDDNNANIYKSLKNIKTLVESEFQKMEKINNYLKNALQMINTEISTDDDIKKPELNSNALNEKKDIEVLTNSIIEQIKSYKSQVSEKTTMNESFVKGITTICNDIKKNIDKKFKFDVKKINEDQNYAIKALTNIKTKIDDLKTENDNTIQLNESFVNGITTICEDIQTNIDKDFEYNDKQLNEDPDSATETLTNIKTIINDLKTENDGTKELNESFVKEITTICEDIKKNIDKKFKFEVKKLNEDQNYAIEAFANIKTKINDLKTENDGTKELNESFVSGITTICEDIQTKIDKDFEFNAKQLNEDPDYVTETLTKIQAKIDDLKTKIDDLKTENDDIKELNESFVNRVTTICEDIKKNIDKNFEFNAKQLNEDPDYVTETLTKIQAKIDDLKTKIDDLKTENDGTKELNESFVNGITTICEDIQTNIDKDFEFDAKQLNEDSKHATETLAKIKNQIDSSKKLNDSFKGQIKTIYSVLKDINNETNDGNTESKNLETEMTYIKDNFETWTDRLRNYEQLQDEYNRLQSGEIANATDSRWKEEFLKMRLHYEQQLQLFFENEEDFVPINYLTKEEQSEYGPQIKKTYTKKQSSTSSNKNEPSEEKPVQAKSTDVKEETQTEKEEENKSETVTKDSDHEPSDKNEEEDKTETVTKDSGNEPSDKNQNNETGKKKKGKNSKTGKKKRSAKTKPKIVKKKDQKKSDNNDDKPAHTDSIDDDNHNQEADSVEHGSQSSDNENGDGSSDSENESNAENNNGNEETEETEETNNNNGNKETEETNNNNGNEETEETNNNNGNKETEETNNNNGNKETEETNNNNDNQESTNDDKNDNKESTNNDETESTDN